MILRRNRKDEPEHIRLARRKVRSKKRFFRHFSVYGVFTLFLLGINMLDNFLLDPWFMYPALSWGTLVAIHYLWVFGLPGSNAGTREWEERELAREIERLAPEEPLAALPPEKPLKADEFDLDAHLELREVSKEKAEVPVYRNDDLV